MGIKNSWNSYSRRVSKENKGLNKAESGLGRGPGWVRGGTKEACPKALAVVFQCQIVPRACCYSTPYICIWGTPAIFPSHQRTSVHYNQLQLHSFKDKDGTFSRKASTSCKTQNYCYNLKCYHIKTSRWENNERFSSGTLGNTIICNSWTVSKFVQLWKCLNIWPNSCKLVTIGVVSIISASSFLFFRICIKNISVYQLTCQINRVP